jgi:hypothetical protein
LIRGRDEHAIRALQDRLGDAFTRLNTIAPEARHERITRLGGGPDPAPLLRTLLRLRHDLVMMGRAALAPLPQPLRAPLSEPLNRVAASAAEYLRASATALRLGGGPAPLDAFEAALHAYAQEVGAVRHEGSPATCRPRRSSISTRSALCSSSCTATSSISPAA